MSKEPRVLSIRVSYEPNRLAKVHLSSAYEILIPITRRRVNVIERIKQSTTKNVLKNFGGS